MNLIWTETCKGFQSCTVPSSDAVKTVSSPGFVSFDLSKIKLKKKKTFKIKKKTFIQKDGLLISKIYLNMRKYQKGNPGSYQCLGGHSSDVFAACEQLCGRFLRSFSNPKHTERLPSYRQSRIDPAHRKTVKSTFIKQNLTLHKIKP